MSIFHKVFRYLINIVCLSLSITLTVYFFFGLSGNRIFRIVVVPAVIIIECLAQYILSMGRFYLKKRRLWKAGLLIFAYIWYLVVFALFSGISYFNAEIAAKEKAASRVVFAESAGRQKWQQNNILIASLNKQLETEAKTGYGSRSVEIMKQIERLKAEQAELEAGFRQGAASPEVEVVDMFGALAETFGIPANKLKIFVFGTIVMFIYLGLTLTNWDIRFDVTTGPTAVTNAVTDETEKKFSLCPVCNSKFPASNNRIYCSNRCKQVAYRESKAVTNTAIKGGRGNGAVQF